MARRTDPTVAVCNALHTLLAEIPAGCRIEYTTFSKDSDDVPSVLFELVVEDVAETAPVLRKAIESRMKPSGPRSNEARVEVASRTLAANVEVRYRHRQDYNGPVWELETGAFSLNEAPRGIFYRYGHPAYRSFSHGDRWFARDKASVDAFLQAAEAAGGEVQITSFEDAKEAE